MARPTLSHITLYFATLGLLLGALGCGGAAVETTSLRMAGNASDASVTIDDKYIGVLGYLARQGVALPPGQHRITVEKVGYFPWDKLVTAEAPDKPIRLDIQLTKIPD